MNLFEVMGLNIQYSTYYTVQYTVYALYINFQDVGIHFHGGGIMLACFSLITLLGERRPII